MSPKTLTTRLRQKTNAFFEDDRTKNIQKYLPPLNFITIHYAYFITTCLIFSLIFWGSSNPTHSISYLDSLFLVVSAMTEAGLNTVNLSQMTTFQQVLLWILIVIGSAIFVSISTVLTRKRVFEKRFDYVVKAQREARRLRRRSMSQMREVPVIERLNSQRKTEEPVVKSDFESRHSGPRDPTNGLFETPAGNQSGLGAVRESEETDEMVKVGGQDVVDEGVHDRRGSVTTVVDEGVRDRRGSIVTTTGPTLRLAPTSPALSNTRVINFVGVGEHPNASSTSYRLPHSRGGITQRGRSNTATTGQQSLHDLHYPSYLTKTVTGRNSQFHGLSRDEREHLGGVEYRAITLLAYIVPIYFVMWQLLGCVGLGAYMAHNKASVAEMNGINPWWLGIFNGASAFNNSGMSLLDANMIPFKNSVYTLLTMSLMILAGNTAYPLFLRLIIWSGLKIMNLFYPLESQHPETKATLRFILRYPRRVYTNLFPSTPTWWLLFMVVCLNGIDWVAFEVLNIGNAAVEDIPKQFRVLDGLFQAFAVRSGGFYVIAIPSLRIGLQFLYVVMMYISVYPVVITMRHSNVYEERSLGIYADDPPLEKEGTYSKLKRTLTNSVNPSHGVGVGAQQFINQQIRSQLAHDIWLLIVSILLIVILETPNFARDPITYSVFNIMFEVVSAYGCVGISTGLPDQAYSFSGGWRRASKFILIIVMLRGRHRGLPVALDRAVRLPGEFGRGEEEDWEVRRGRREGELGV
ncbi:hypothetical protein GLAREA_06962 [Glarea lozoyensis ATCC 20868]|uniref:Potassium transport protein n=1 Tax=Glarea lozoyensis (strain ATCC 20868 / MF5171) TaxID=1116229 RepID=S3D9Y8_GLAL2|nr:uncharacterized protein GLAREA_06962 [Glarea lozoyensis ATCC 20868]EPE33949.1 hypothetical protein GLAREA_06962 [Glarea lozoyensis ATCC 20868]